jgi:hypothetical protein
MLPLVLIVYIPKLLVRTGQHALNVSDHVAPAPSYSVYPPADACPRRADARVVLYRSSEKVPCTIWRAHNSNPGPHDFCPDREGVFPLLQLDIDLPSDAALALPMGYPGSALMVIPLESGMTATASRTTRRAAHALSSAARSRSARSTWAMNASSVSSD